MPEGLSLVDLSLHVNLNPSTAHQLISIAVSKGCKISILNKKTRQKMEYVGGELSPGDEIIITSGDDEIYLPIKKYTGKPSHKIK